MVITQCFALMEFYVFPMFCTATSLYGDETNGRERAEGTAQSVQSDMF